MIPDFTNAEIDKFSAFGEFMNAYVELHKQTISLLYIMVDYRYGNSQGIPIEISKDEAIIGGNITRLIKLKKCMNYSCHKRTKN